MDNPQIVLPRKKGEPVTLTVTKPTVLAKRTYFKNTQIYNEHLIRTAAARADRDKILDAIKEPSLSSEEREKLIGDAKTAFDKIVTLNDKAYEITCRQVFDILIPVGDEKPVKYDDIDWDSADDNELEEMKSFFAESCSPRTKKSNEPVPDTSTES